MGNSRTWRRRLKANQPTALEKRIQKRYRKATGTPVTVRLNQNAKMVDTPEEDEPT